MRKPSAELDSRRWQASGHLNGNENRPTAPRVTIKESGTRCAMRMRVPGLPLVHPSFTPFPADPLISSLLAFLFGVAVCLRPSCCRWCANVRSVHACARANVSACQWFLCSSSASVRAHSKDSINKDTKSRHAVSLIFFWWCTSLPPSSHTHVQGSHHLLGSHIYLASFRFSGFLRPQCLTRRTWWCFTSPTPLS